MNVQGIFIIPYFGRLPDYFPFWLKSCEGNPFFHWLLITDCEIDSTCPSNVIVKKTSFEDFANRVQSCFNFGISLETPYKICDFRPAYGTIFQKEILGYAYWGFCDMDLIWGDLLPLAEVAQKQIYDKIGDLGHCMLLKNTPKHVNAYQTKFCDSLFYRDVFSSPRNMIFDEDGSKYDGFSSICEKLGMSVYSARENIADIRIRNFSLRKILYNASKKEKRHHEIYLINQNNVTEIYENKTGVICHENELYVHFQKRKISVETGNINHCLLIPPGRIIDAPEIFEHKLLSLAPAGFCCFWWNFRVSFRRIPLRIKMFCFHSGRIVLDILGNYIRFFYKKNADTK